MPVVARDPLLVVVPSGGSRDHRCVPRDAVVRAADRDRSAALGRDERGDQPNAVRRVIGDGRVADDLERPGGARVRRQGGEDPRPPRRSRVPRRGVAGRERAAAREAPDLERRDDRRPPRRAVGLDLRLVLRLGIDQPVVRHPDRDDFARMPDTILGVRVHDVAPRPACHGPRPPLRGRVLRRLRCRLRMRPEAEMLGRRRPRAANDLRPGGTRRGDQKHERRSDQTAHCPKVQHSAARD